MSFRYDGSGIHAVYPAAREMSAATRAIWAEALRDHLGSAPLARVLDVGCGTGRFARLFLEIFPVTVYGVDPSRDMLNASAPLEDPDALRLIQAVAEQLPIKAGSVDVVFLAWVYHHLGAQGSALSEFARVLGHEGRLAVATATHETLDSYLWMRFFPSARAIDQERMPARSALVEAARRSGFEPDRLTTVRQPTAQGLAAYAERVARRAISTLRLVSDSEFEAGLRALTRYCAAHDQGQAVHEDVDLFVFRRSRS